MPTVRKVVEELQRYNQEEHVAVAVWSEDDVIHRAEEINVKISREKAQEIIDRIDRKQTATLGITWDTIDCYLDDLDDMSEGG